MGITGIHSEQHSYSNAYINRAGLACLLPRRLSWWPEVNRGLYKEIQCQVARQIGFSKWPMRTVTQWPRLNPGKGFGANIAVVCQYVIGFCSYFTQSANKKNYIRTQTQRRTSGSTHNRATQVMCASLQRPFDLTLILNRGQDPRIATGLLMGSSLGFYKGLQRVAEGV